MFKYIVKNGKNVTLVQFFSLGGEGGVNTYERHYKTQTSAGQYEEITSGVR